MHKSTSRRTSLSTSSRTTNTAAIHTTHLNLLRQRRGRYDRNSTSLHRSDDMKYACGQQAALSIHLCCSFYLDDGKVSSTSQRNDSQHDHTGPLPPPPPPPPPKKTSKGLPLWGATLLLLGGAVLWWKFIDTIQDFQHLHTAGQVPDVYRDSDGFQYVLTKGGNKVVVGEDNSGRVYFVDGAGNFYYDSGNPDIGFYVVTGDDKVYNIFADATGERQRVFVGGFQDLQTQKIKSLGGIPVEDIKKAYGKSFDGTMTGFVAPMLKGEKAPTEQDFGSAPVPRAIVEYAPEGTTGGK